MAKRRSALKLFKIKQNGRLPQFTIFPDANSHISQVYNRYTSLYICIYIYIYTHNHIYIYMFSVFGGLCVHIIQLDFRVKLIYEYSPRKGPRLGRQLGVSLCRFNPSDDAPSWGFQVINGISISVQFALKFFVCTNKGNGVWTCMDLDSFKPWSHRTCGQTLARATWTFATFKLVVDNFWNQTAQCKKSCCAFVSIFIMLRKTARHKTFEKVKIQHHILKYPESNKLHQAVAKTIIM